jgi:hypothetical protein
VEMNLTVGCGDGYEDRPATHECMVTDLPRMIGVLGYCATTQAGERLATVASRRRGSPWLLSYRTGGGIRGY